MRVIRSGQAGCVPSHEWTEVRGRRKRGGRKKKEPKKQISAFSASSTLVPGAGCEPVCLAAGCRGFQSTLAQGVDCSLVLRAGHEGAGVYGVPVSIHLAAHGPAGGGAADAGRCAVLAVVVTVFAALLGAGMAYVRAQPADVLGVGAALGHGLDGQRTGRCAFEVVPDAGGHGLGVLFLKAGGGALVAGHQARLAGRYAFLEAGGGRVHGNLQKSRFPVVGRMGAAACRRGGRGTGVQGLARLALGDEAAGESMPQRKRSLRQPWHARRCLSWRSPCSLRRLLVTERCLHGFCVARYLRMRRSMNTPSKGGIQPAGRSLSMFIVKSIASLPSWLSREID